MVQPVFHSVFLVCPCALQNIKHLTGLCLAGVKLSESLGSGFAGVTIHSTGLGCLGGFDDRLRHLMLPIMKILGISQRPPGYRLRAFGKDG